MIGTGQEEFDMSLKDAGVDVDDTTLPSNFNEITAKLKKRRDSIETRWRDDQEGFLTFLRQKPGSIQEVTQLIVHISVKLHRLQSLDNIESSQLWPSLATSLKRSLHISARGFSSTICLPSSEMRP